MKVVFVTNFINHHQVPLADEFFKLFGNDYKFIATTVLPESFIRSGYSDFSNRPYLIEAFNEDSLKSVESLIINADVLISGLSTTLEIVRKRIKDDKLTFIYSERLFKKRIPYKISNWFNLFKEHTVFRSNNVHVLCASAYLPNDLNLLFAYPNKRYKWGYFTSVVPFAIEDEVQLKKNKSISMLWCGRFIDWKHPEMPIKLAKKLKDHGYVFHIDMIGSGEMIHVCKNMISDFGLEKEVTLLGNISNEDVKLEMHKHHIFLFTSDRNEGWGAVLNEAMSCGCVPIVSEMIGAAPYLIENGKNGLLFKSENLNSLESQVRHLLDKPNLIDNFAFRAYETMLNQWNPTIATRRFINLVQSIQKKHISDENIIGPCSIAKTKF